MLRMEARVRPARSLRCGRIFARALREFGYDGLFDRRRGKPSPKRVPLPVRMVTMSQKQLQRVKVIENAAGGRLSVCEALPSAATERTSGTTAQAALFPAIPRRDSSGREFINY